MANMSSCLMNNMSSCLMNNIDMSVVYSLSKRADAAEVECDGRQPLDDSNHSPPEVSFSRKWLHSIAQHSAFVHSVRQRPHASHADAASGERKKKSGLRGAQKKSGLRGAQQKKSGLRGAQQKKAASGERKPHPCVTSKTPFIIAETPSSDDSIDSILASHHGPPCITSYLPPPFVVLVS